MNEYHKQFILVSHSNSVINTFTYIPIAMWCYTKKGDWREEESPTKPQVSAPDTMQEESWHEQMAAIQLFKQA